MFDTITGIPLHPLVVHGVVVLLPLTVLGTLAIALRPAWRRTYGPLVVGIGVVATALVPVATQSGKKFEKTLQLDVGKHQQLGDQLIWFALPLLALLIALVVLDRREAAPASESGSSTPSTAIKVVAALAIVASLATAYQVFRVGDSGARKVWCGGVYDCKPVQ
ncbi:hypothetical protein EFK50_00865 [Nocardioides marmoriginsengisoli]|uniref:DUF2231 domain-containing protein n=1 Tax=Nocardioides marmoriginsengisoli TaxID=661483 RepID=A0A3N0CS67_9ACTN|nr:DUF2231 domain-containing protein [Nocardioides marmoriginsengisoli]RNL66209.1 hypothetical protein EFK50_00865 [Nocardioides marmoriginsengisoli]